MMKGTVTLGFLLLALIGCGGGQAGAIPADVAPTYSFEAKVAVNPTQLQINKRVSFNLEVTSASSQPVKTDILLRVISADGETLYESVWHDVLFHENEVWNLTQGFLPASDAGRKAWRVTILVRNQETREVLFNESIATLDFNQ